MAGVRNHSAPLKSQLFKPKVEGFTESESVLKEKRDHWPGTNGEVGKYGKETNFSTTPTQE